MHHHHHLHSLHSTPLHAPSMADQVPLPPTVESLIQQICHQQSQPPPDAQARQELASLGEDASLCLLTDIRRTTINSTFNGFIVFLARKYRSAGSPGNFASPRPSTEVVLPESVEKLIGSICRDQSQPPLGMDAKRKLESLGEEEALRLLNTIHLSKIVKSFDGFVMYLAKSVSPRPSPSPPMQESIFSSPSYAPSSAASHCCPHVRALDEVTSSLMDRLTLSPVPTTRQPGGQTILPCMNNRQSNDHAPSPATNGGISKGHTPYSSTSIEKPNGQFMGSPTNISEPNAQALGPSFHASKPNAQASASCTTFGEPNGQCLASSTNVLMPNAQAFAPSMSTWKPDGQTPSPVLQALHELEFRKAFLILSYLGRNRNKLEEVISASEIKDLAVVQPMGKFENIIWDGFGKLYCETKDRVKHIDWDSGRRYNYHCYICSDGSFSLKGPYLNKTATLLQKVLGDENVLIVKFYDLNSSSKNVDSSLLHARFHTVAEEGIFVGLKRFRFFVFKDGGKEEKRNTGSGAIKSYYVNVDSFARFYENKASYFDISMHTRRCLFMHVHNVSSLSAYMARFSLILSKTITLDVNLDDPDVLVEEIEDIPCQDERGVDTYDQDGKLRIHTDGTGFISEELALSCPRNILKGSSPDDELLERYIDTLRRGNASKLDMLQPPLLIQFRMFYKGRAVKGTVLVNKKLQGKKIQIRDSMIKVKPDQGILRTPAVNFFEIVTTSSRPRKARLSQYLIALLNYGGVPRDFFINLLANEILHARNSLSKSNIRAALKVALMHGEIDDNYTIARMILSGIPLDESYIQLRMPFFVNQEVKNLRKGRLQLDDSFFLIGTADPTGSLKSNEVCVIHETGQIEGDVLVYRHPGVHFGDVHILKATRVEGMEDFVGTSKYGIFFPTNGPRSLADKMAGGDFDGDTFLVSRHPMLLTTFKQREPWTPTPICSQSASVNRKPSEFTAEELEHELFQMFLTTRFQPSSSVGHAADAWLCHMDKLLSSDDQKDDKHSLKDKMCRLVDIYYEALDAPKKGKKVEVPPDLNPRKFPHFMGRNKQSSYISTSILGEIFDKVDEFIVEAPPVQVRKLPCFDIEVPLRCITSWEDHYRSYRKEMAEALNLDDEVKNDAANDIIQKYKQILYGADEFEKSVRAWEEIRFDAVALYHAAYGYAMQQGKASYCGFAWKVAGSVLMKIFIEEQSEKPILCLPSVLREIL